MGSAIGKWTVKYDDEKELWYARNPQTGENLYSDDRGYLIEVLEKVGI